MGATFVVTLREAFEAALLLGIVYTYLDKLGGRRLYGYATGGAVAGVVASLALGAAVARLSGPWLDVGPDVLGAAVVFAAAALLTWHGWWMRRHARAVRGAVEQRIAAARAARRLWIVGLIAFTGVFREGAETVLFLWGLMAQATSAAGAGGLAGAALGIGAAAALGWVVFRGGARLSLPTFFTATSILLVFVAAGLCATGVGKLQGLGVLPPTPSVWDTSALLSDDGIAGTLLAGLAGYRARPSVLEVAAWAAYLGIAGLLLIGPRAVPRAVQSASGSRATPA